VRTFDNHVSLATISQTTRWLLLSRQSNAPIRDELAVTWR